MRLGEQPVVSQPRRFLCAATLFEVERDGLTLCRPCAGQAYYRSVEGAAASSEAVEALAGAIAG